MKSSNGRSAQYGCWIAPAALETDRKEYPERLRTGESVATMVRNIGMSNRIQPEYRVSHQISTVDEQRTQDGTYGILINSRRGNCEGLPVRLRSHCSG